MDISQSSGERDGPQGSVHPLKCPGLGDTSQLTVRQKVLPYTLFLIYSRPSSELVEVTSDTRHSTRTVLTQAQHVARSQCEL